MLLMACAAAPLAGGVLIVNTPGKQLILMSERSPAHQVRLAADGTKPMTDLVSFNPSMATRLKQRRMPGRKPPDARSEKSQSE